jgi:aryl-alcohol dehydrogenase-like predicted oxidoreductase
VAPARDLTTYVGVGPLLGTADVIGEGGVCDAFDELVRRGRLVGRAFTGLDTAPAVIETLAASGRFDAFNISYSLADMITAAWEGGSPPLTTERLSGRAGADIGSRYGLGVIAVRALVGGRLVCERRLRSDARGNGPELGSRNDLAVLAAQGLLTGLACEFAGLASPGELAVRLVLADPTIASTVVGVANERDLADVASASDRESVRGQELTQRCNALLRELSALHRQGRANV